MIPSLTEKDACWLGKLKVVWEEDPEPGFVPSKSVREFLGRYPNGMRRAVGEAAKRLGLDLSNDDTDDMAQDLIVMFLDFASNGFEDIMERRGTLYCDETCKKRAARAGSSQLTAEPKITGITPQLNQRVANPKTGGQWNRIANGPQPLRSARGGVGDKPRSPVEVGRAISGSRSS